MALPLPVAPGPTQLPVQRPISLDAQLAMLTGPSRNYLSGRVAGTRLVYLDLSAFAWWVIADPDARFRSSVQETAGDVLRGVSAVDVSATEAFPVFSQAVGSVTQFVPATQEGRPSHALEVSRRLQEEHTESYQYATLLGRLSRYYPPQVLASAPQVTGRSTMTAREALQFVLEQWQAEAAWLTWAPLPEFLLSTSEGLLNLETEAIALLQPEGTGRRSMRDLLDEFLRVFTGYVLRANSSNELEVVAPPWVVQELPRQISPVDVYDLTRQGEVDYHSIVNRATVQLQRWEYQSGQEVMQPAAMGVWSGQRPERFGTPNPDSDWPAWTGSPGGELWLGNVNALWPFSGTWPGVDDILTGTAFVFLDAYIEGRLEYVGSSARGRTSPIVIWRAEYQPIQLTAQAAAGSTSLSVEPLEFAIPAGRHIAFGNVIAITTAAAAQSATALSVQPIGSSLELGAIGDTSRVRVPLNGQEIVAADASFHQSVGGLTTTTHRQRLLLGGNSDGSVQARWTDTPGSPNGLIGGYGIGGLTAAAMRVVLRGIGQTWGQSHASEQVTFGRVGEGHDATVPGLELSQAEFGIIDATLNASFFSPTMEQAMLIAQAYVHGNMWPVERFQVEQGPALPVYPDDIGRLIRLPNDVEGTVESWQYSDAFSFDSAIVNSGFTIVRTLLPSAEDSAIESVTVHPGSVTIIEGGGLQLHAIVHGTGLYSHAVTWSSSDEAVATVNAFGAVTAINVGTAVITATSVQDPTRSGTATVTVSEDEEIEE